MLTFKAVITCIFSIMLFSTFLSTSAYGETNSSFSKAENPSAHILVVYSTDNGKVDTKVRMLDMLLSHFSTHLSFKSAKSVQKSDLQNITHLFYFGAVETELPATFKKLSNSFTKTYVAMGANVEQLGKPFSFVKASTQVPIKQLMDVQRKKRAALPDNNLIYEMKLNQPVQTLTEALNQHKVYPLLVRHHDSYYFANGRLNSLFALFFAQGLHHIFHSSSQTIHPAYIRLEDVHPMADPEKLMEIGKFLYHEHIPYMIATIPVFKDPKTHREYHYSDAPKVVKALQYMQSHGGSIVMHGYTHQYRKSETGEGFEFWDVKNNTPIFAPPDQKIVTRPKSEFPDEKSYQAYLATQKQFEKKYINTKLTKGIQELTTHKLYPLAFEAPHYVMSQEGYKILSHYFSTYVGQIQMSNEDWHMMRAAPYITHPTFMNNMLLLPETIGYVPAGDPKAVEKMMSQAHQQLIIQDGIIGGFYHPYLGMDPFRKLVQKMEQIPNISWIDLKKLDNKTQAPNITITSGPNGIKTNSDLTFTKYKMDIIGGEVEGHIMWALVGIAGSAVLLFILNLIHIRRVHRKGLKAERMRSHG